MPIASFKKIKVVKSIFCKLKSKRHSVYTKRKKEAVFWKKKGCAALSMSRLRYEKQNIPSVSFIFNGREQAKMRRERVDFVRCNRQKTIWPASILKAFYGRFDIKRFLFKPIIRCRRNLHISGIFTCRKIDINTLKSCKFFVFLQAFCGREKTHTRETRYNISKTFASRIFL